ncbi:MAG: dephospho-CoA kinase [Synergistaceae bacterium]|nr:dephospho-CoA kinase [Synergistaceae bacterium]
MIIAVTGSIGAGKSTVSKLLAEKICCERFDADSIVAELWQSGEIKSLAIKRWGNKIIDSSGNIIKSEISRQIFTHESEYKFCNDMLHSQVMSELYERAKNLTNSVLEIPLLFEAGRPSWINIIIYVRADYKIRLARCINNRGWTEQELLRRGKFLLPESIKISQSDYIIMNNKGLDDLQGEINSFVEKFII